MSQRGFSMNNPQHKAAITKALNRFTTGSLVQNARNLLNTLGYQSERTLALESSTAETFIAAYDRQGKLNRDRALTAEWCSIDLLFQLSGTDLTLTDTAGWLFDSSQSKRYLSTKALIRSLTPNTPTQTPMYPNLKNGLIRQYTCYTISPLKKLKLWKERKKSESRIKQIARIF